MIAAGKTRQRTRRLLVRAGVSAQLALWALAARAQDAAPPLASGRDVIAIPGIGRVVAAFLITAALAVAAAVVLRRVLPRFGGALLPAGNVRVEARASLGAGLRVHVIDVGGEKILLAENRTALAAVVLDNKVSGQVEP